MFIDLTYGTSTLSLLKVLLWHEKKTIRRIWRLDNRTHNALINLINEFTTSSYDVEKKI